LTPVPEDARATVVRFTPRGRRLLTAVIGFVEEIEADFAARLAPGELDRIRDGLLAIADRVDPDGALGVGDRPADQARETKHQGRR
jgi:DNA-binding MarR family transcriptional regulator